MDNQQYDNTVVTQNQVGRQRNGGVWVSLPVCILCILLSCLFVFMATFVSLSLTMKREINRAYGEAAKYEKLLEVAELYEQYYYYDTDDKQAAERLASVYGMAVGDTFTSYYTAEEWQKSYETSMGNAIGIGIYVSADTEGRVVILRVMADSPAEKAGLMQGDIILSVDGTLVEKVGYVAATDLILGEINTEVALSVQRGEETMEVRVMRGQYTPQTVFAETVTVDDTLYGYLYITGFEGTTKSQFISAMNELRSEGAKGLIFDVRSNPGGELEVIVDILDILLPEGPIVHLLEKGKDPFTYTSDDEEVNLPMVVLTNDGTASAAELFTAALKDYEKAVIVGEKTFGKGCGQVGRPLSDGSVVFITNFLYNPPFSDNYDGVGIVPDHEVELDAEYQSVNVLMVPHDKDAQLAAAINILHEKTK
ncbi:MAG: S41 family peptidase [Clostridia bacterium]|nr:S41 family peptidase [Clostridia bacterium]